MRFPVTPSPIVRYEITLVIRWLSPLTLRTSGSSWAVAVVLVIQNPLAALFSFFLLLDDFLRKLLGLLHSYLEKIIFYIRVFALAFFCIMLRLKKKTSSIMLCGRVKPGWDLGILGGVGGNSTKKRKGGEGRNAASFSRSLHGVPVCCWNFLTRTQYMVFLGLIYFCLLSVSVLLPFNTM